MSATKKTAEPTLVLSTRVTPDLAERLEQRAAEADRSVSGEIRHIVRKALETEEGYPAA